MCLNFHVKIFLCEWMMCKNLPISHFWYKLIHALNYCTLLRAQIFLPLKASQTTAGWRIDITSNMEMVCLSTVTYKAPLLYLEFFGRQFPVVDVDKRRNEIS